MDYFNEVIVDTCMFKDEDIKDDPIWKKYSDSLFELERKDRGW